MKVEYQQTLYLKIFILYGRQEVKEDLKLSIFEMATCQFLFLLMGDEWSGYLPSI